jgi:Gpi18-like mannosyltransferase
VNLDFRSGDYNTFLIHWVEYFRTSGGFAGLRAGIGNYNIPYYYFLALFSYSSINDLYLIKFLSICFDVVMAFGMMKLAGVFTRSKPKRLAAYLLTLLLPTVVLNSAMWGQCDSIYVAFVVLSLWLALSGRPKLSVMCLAISFGFKLQAVFVMPLFLPFLFAGKIKLRHLLVFPLTYIALVLPAIAFGLPVMDALLLYYRQADAVRPWLSLNSPSIFAFATGGANVSLLSSLGIAAAFLYVALISLWTWRKRENLSNEALLGLAVLFSVGVPFLLPHMHDRYFFAADILTLLPAVLLLRYAPVPILASFASLICYYAYFRRVYLLPPNFGATALIGVLLIMFIFTADKLSSRRHMRA